MNVSFFFLWRLKLFNSKNVHVLPCNISFITYVLAFICCCVIFQFKIGSTLCYRITSRSAFRGSYQLIAISGMQSACSCCQIYSPKKLGCDWLRRYACKSLQLQHFGKSTSIWSSLRLPQASSHLMFSYYKGILEEKPICLFKKNKTVDLA